MLPWLLSQSQSFYDLAYADDTAIFTGTTERGQQVLHKIQEVAVHSSLTLNYKKCELLRSQQSTASASSQASRSHRPSTSGSGSDPIPRAKRT